MYIYAAPRGNSSYVVHAISPNVNKLIPNSIKLMGGTQTVITITMLTVLQVLNDEM